jgi:sugar (pentulose or hexulose) kinase
MKNVIAVFDIGKTNKKILLFDEKLQVVSRHEERFPTITDEDGVECDDIDLMEKWIKTTMVKLAQDKEFNVLGVNFSTYGATLIYLDSEGERLTPAYNYLKTMPDGIIAPLYERWGGIEEFSRRTASPAFVDNMLNSGLQALWLKKCRPEVFARVKDVVHFPQYLSQLLTGKVNSEYTSIGCHTAMWDFDNKDYHPWLKDEGIPVPTPIGNDAVYDVEFAGKTIKVGIGIHDSSASLAPYIIGSKDKFLLISTGTWCINMNPFNDEPLTADQLKKDSLCYMSVSMNPVKSSRLFMGHIHEVNSNKLTEHFNLPYDEFKQVKADAEMVKKMIANKPVFFKNGVPDNYIDETVDYSQFFCYSKAYHQLVIDITRVLKDSIDLVMPANDETITLYISGGFARNEIFVRLLASFYPGKMVYTTEIDNSTALGAAIVLWKKAFDGIEPKLDLGLKKVEPFKF